MLDPVYLMIEPDKLALLAFAVAGFGALFVFFASAIRLFTRRHVPPVTGYDTKSRHLQDAKDIIIMALLDDIAAQAAAIEATDAAAAAKIDDLTSRLAVANAAIEASRGDVDAANALAARLKAANDALQAKVAA